MLTSYLFSDIKTEVHKGFSMICLERAKPSPDAILGVQLIKTFDADGVCFELFF